MEHHRKKFIGGSDAGVILGLSPFKTPYDLWLEKTSEEEEYIDDEKRKFFDRRKAFEPFVVSRLIDECGLDVSATNQRYYYDNSTSQTLLDSHYFSLVKLAHIDISHIFLTAEIDYEYFGNGVFFKCINNGEVKTVHPSLAWMWGEAASSDIPTYIQAQCMHGLMVTGRETCTVAALIGIDDLRLYEIKRDQETIDFMLEKEKEFWNMVQSKTPPPPTNGGDVAKMFKKDTGKSIIANNQLFLKIDELKQIKNNIKQLEKRQDALETLIKFEFKDASAITDAAGNQLATWKSQESSRFDSKAFAQEHPDMHQLFKATNEFRVLRIK